MKKLLLLAIFSLLILPANSQSKYEKQSNEIIELFDSIKSNFTETEEGIKIIKVVELPNIEKDKIYIAALEALSNIYKDSKEVIQNKDKELGTIFGKGIFFESSMSTWGVLTESKCKHAIKIEVKDYKCNDEKIKNAKGPNGRSYGLLDGIKVQKDSYGDEGCKKYYCNQDKNSWQKYKYKASGCKGTENKRGKETDAELTLAEISKYPKSKKDEEIKNGSGKINQKEIVEVSAEEKAKATADPTYKAKCKIVETYTESKCPGHYGCDGKHSKKYCPGHVNLNVKACIVVIDKDEAVQLYQIDPGDNDSKV